MNTIICHRSEITSIDNVEKEYFQSVDYNEKLQFADGSPSPNSIRTQVRLEYSDSMLFVLFNGNYEQLNLSDTLYRDSSTGKTMKLWKHADVVEVFVGPDARHTKRYKEFQVSPDGAWLDIEQDRMLSKKSNHFWRSGFRSHSIIDEQEKKWYAGFAIPWICLGESFHRERLWHINLYRAKAEEHGLELQSWCATGYGDHCFHRPEKFGAIVFR